MSRADHARAPRGTHYTASRQQRNSAKPFRSRPNWLRGIGHSPRHRRAGAPERPIDTDDWRRRRRLSSTHSLRPPDLTAHAGSPSEPWPHRASDRRLRPTNAGRPGLSLRSGSFATGRPSRGRHYPLRHDPDQARPAVCGERIEPANGLFALSWLYPPGGPRPRARARWSGRARLRAPRRRLEADQVRGHERRTGARTTPTVYGANSAAGLSPPEPAL